MTERLHKLLRRDRLIAATALILVTVLAWAYILAGAGMGMSGLEMTRHTRMGMDMMPPGSWNLQYIILMFFMWWVMMIAMMLPSATPVILLAVAINRRSGNTPAPYGPASQFCLGYLLGWALFSAIAVFLQWLLLEGELISGMLRSSSAILSAALLVIAGAWQFTPWKQACLRHCRGPVEFLSQHRRPGRFGTLIMGMHHGLYCLGCCWFLMLLLFVGGVMNLYWIAGLAIYVWMEKIMVVGQKASRLTGVALIIWGVVIVLSSLV